MIETNEAFQKKEKMLIKDLCGYFLTEIYNTEQLDLFVWQVTISGVRTLKFCRQNFL